MIWPEFEYSLQFFFEVQQVNSEGGLYPFY